MGSRLATVLIAAGLLAIGAEGAGVYLYAGDLLPVSEGQAYDMLKGAPFTVDRSDKPTYPLSGTITSGTRPLADAVVSADGVSVTTGPDGAFSLSDVPVGPVTITRPAYMPATYDFDGVALTAAITLEPRIVKAIRIVPDVAADDAKYQNLINLAAATTVNAFIFDTKGDSDSASGKHDGGLIYYDSKVPAAVSAGLVAVRFDVAKRLAEAKAAGLYTMTRIPTFLDPVYAQAYPADVLAGDWLDPGNRNAWEYPLALAEEACTLGFDEIQFDYVRYPSGQAASQARSAGKVPDAAGRTANIKAYLTEAVARLHPLGCAVSADIFGIVNAIADDQGIGQLVEEVTQPLDAYSPMIYPEQWGAGWFGLDQPSSHPAELVTSVLNAATPRVAPGVIIRPWLQSYYYSGKQILSEIAAAEAQGHGWILWNSPGNYSASGLPAGTG
jgi:hypothetical protein